MDNPNPTEEQWHADFLKGSLQSGAARYRDLADRLDRAADDVARVASAGTRRSYTDLAVSMLSEVRSAQGNAGWLERAVTEAAQADLARAAGAAQGGGGRGMGGPSYVDPEDQSSAERKAVAAVERLARAWPPGRLGFFAAGQSLLVVRDPLADPAEMEILAEIDGIRASGGDF